MKQLYFYVFDVIMLFYICLPIWPNINTFWNIVDPETFFDLWTPKILPTYALKS